MIIARNRFTRALQPITIDQKRGFMNTYQICDSIETANEYLKLCRERKEPYLVIRSDQAPKGYRHIEYDLSTASPWSKRFEPILEDLESIYRSYVKFFRLDDDVWSFAGGSMSAGFVVKKEHAEFIAKQLIDYLPA